MLNWIVNFSTRPGLLAFPRLLTVASETRASPEYCCEGRFRQEQDYCLFKYTLEGEGAFTDGRGEHRVQAGYGFLCCINDPATKYYFPADAQGPWTFVYACFSGGRVSEMVAQMVSDFGPIYTLDREQGAVPGLLAWRRQRGRLVDLSLARGYECVSGLLTALVAAKERQQVEAAAGRLVREARAWIFEHLEEDINAGDLARGLKVSREHLARSFKARTGFTPYHYIQAEKMKRACRLLKDSNLSSKEIAARLGFPNPAHFTRSFKRMIHMTPTRFREKGSAPLA